MQANFADFYWGSGALKENPENPCEKNGTVGCRICTRRPMAGDIQLTCSDCGQDFPSPLPIRRSFRNAVTLRLSVANLAAWQRKTTKAVEGPATVRLRHREHP